MSPPLLKTQDLTKLYDVVIGVNDVTLELSSGVIGLLGPNGAGKSTLIKLMTGQLRPSAGTIEMFGERPWNNPRVFKRLGYCPEHDAFYDQLTGHEFVTFLGRLSGLGAAAPERAEQALLRVGAAEYLHRPIREYSRGMRQRTKVAQALVHDPDLLILDEPLTGTDPIGRRDMMDLIVSLGQEGKSLIVSSHVLHEVQSMTDEFVMIYGGRILASGHIQEIRDLMDEFPHKIAVRCDQPRRLASRILGELPVAGLEFDEPKGQIEVLTHEPTSFYRGFAQVALEADVAVHEMSSQDDNLQAVFNYLITAR
ncbi:MAG: ABC transporter ATP-binding protein [Planctomycetota bacterium]